MPQASSIKQTHKAIKQYYQALQIYSDQRVTHEGALETAFQRLLADLAKRHDCMLIPKNKLKVANSTIYPDGTIRETLYGTRLGYWEAKDLGDNLDKEISTKIAKGYPLNNTIFENTKRAVLFQGGRERNQFDLTKPNELADLLNDFFAYHEPEIDNFHEAVEEFKSRVPELAGGLVRILNDSHKSNKKFQAAFDSFFALCQQTLNPNISPAAVDEMLVQHLLTERLFRKIFDNPEFIRRNVIAAEIEKVIDALVSLSFNRDSFLRSLDRFYRAIEDAAHTLEDFREKQQFLNTVYERFFQGYSVKVADTHGIVYTPQEIVDFMCASVAEVLEKEFGLSLGSPGVNILDPCTGTGNFIVNILNRIPKKDLPRMYREQLFANEVMLLPYYIAAMNIEHAYFERTGQYEAFEGLCFVDTLDMAEHGGTFSFMTAKNTERVTRQKRTPITVVIGNPPYNVGQLNENDNNKNRNYASVDSRIKLTYVKDSTATLKNKLYDPYVRFFAWATDRLEGRDGIVCFVTNNSFVSDMTFDGMRAHLVKDFTSLYHLDLHGNVRKNPKLSGTTHNIFGIQVGVGITVAIRKATDSDRKIKYQRVSETWTKREKLDFLESAGDLTTIKWQRVEAADKRAWTRDAGNPEFARFLPIGSKETKAGLGSGDSAIFELYTGGAKTNRDTWVYDFNSEQLGKRVARFVETYNAEVFRWSRLPKPVPVDEFVRGDSIKWSEHLKATLVGGHFATFDETKIRRALYRPFTRSHLYYDKTLNDRPGLFSQVFPIERSERENKIICVTGIAADHQTFGIANAIVDIKYGINGNSTIQCFPFYVYDEDGTNRRENIADWALDQFRTHYGDKKISKWDIFYFVYGLLHHPGYRVKFADNLKRELPRIPFAPDFRAFATAGKELARLHLEYESLEPYPLKFIETDGVPLSYRVEDKMRLSRDKSQLRVNPSLTLSGIPTEVFHYRLGNRSAVEWVIDQYQVSEDKRSGIKSDPNRPDDEEYIVRLVGQAVRVSLETVKLVAALPKEYGG